MVRCGEDEEGIDRDTASVFRHFSFHGFLNQGNSKKPSKLAELDFEGVKDHREGAPSS